MEDEMHRTHDHIISAHDRLNQRLEEATQGPECSKTQNTIDPSQQTPVERSDNQTTWVPTTCIDSTPILQHPLIIPNDSPSRQETPRLFQATL